MDKYIHNTSGLEQRYMGVEVPDNAYLLIDPLREKRFQQDDFLIAEIIADNARMSRDGALDLSIVDSLVFLAANDATSISGVNVFASAPSHNDVLSYDSSSDEMIFNAATVVVHRGGVPVTNTPHSILDFGSVDFIVGDTGLGVVKISIDHDAFPAKHKYSDFGWDDVFISGSSFVKMVDVIYRGSDVMGPPIDMIARLRVDSDSTYEVRAIDSVTLLVMAGPITISNTVFMQFDMGAISNINTGPTAIQIQAKRTIGSGSKKCYIGDLSIGY